jgi:hypothetical protein
VRNALESDFLEATALLPALLHYTPPTVSQVSVQGQPDGFIQLHRAGSNMPAEEPKQAGHGEGTVVSVVNFFIF